MTTENSLFNETNSNTPASDQSQENPANTNDQPSLFYVGEGKKYSTVDELDKAYANANDHIGKIENENADLRKQMEELAAKTSAVDKVLEALNGKTGEPEPQEQAATEQVNVADEVARILAEREAASAAKSNQDKVRDALTAKYGEKAGEMYANKGKELGVNLDDLTAQSADAVLALFGTTAQATPAAAPTSNVNTSHLQNNQEDAASPEARYKRGEISREEKFRLQWKQMLNN